MDFDTKWDISDKEKDRYIAAITPELVLLRTKADISQEELATLIGVSRQTYGSIERRVRRMTWSTYLSLIFFYDYNNKTRRMLRSMEAYPADIIKKLNGGADAASLDIGIFSSDKMKNIVEALDDQALHSIRTVIMVEYARCTDTPGDVVVKSFDGVSFTNLTAPEESVPATKALKSIKKGKKTHGEE